MLPDLSGFSKLGSEYKNEQECSKWQKKEEIGAKVYRLKKTFIYVYRHVYYLIKERSDDAKKPNYKSEKFLQIFKCYEKHKTQ